MVFSNRDECNVDVFGMAERNNKSVPWVQGPFCASVTRNAGSMNLLWCRSIVRHGGNGARDEGEE